MIRKTFVTQSFLNEFQSIVAQNVGNGVMKVSKFWSVGVGATFLDTFHFSIYTFSGSSDDFPSILNAAKHFDDP